jgi:hypothetical protein
MRSSNASARCCGDTEALVHSNHKVEAMMLDIKTNYSEKTNTIKKPGSYDESSFHHSRARMCPCPAKVNYLDYLVSYAIG